MGPIKPYLILSLIDDYFTGLGMTLTKNKNMLVSMVSSGLSPIIHRGHLTLFISAIKTSGQVL